MFLVVGGGVFGLTAALELRARGHEVTVLEQGRVPNPLSASADISKAVRMDYGADETYSAHMERALVRWRETKLFHETGTMCVSRQAMVPGGFEHDSSEVLTRRGHKLERLNSAAIRARFPAWKAELFVDGYYNPEGGWAESGRHVAALADEARALGVRLVEDVRVEQLQLKGARVTGVAAQGREWPRRPCHHRGRSVDARRARVPWIRPCFKRAAQPVFHLVPRDPSRFEAERFPSFGADISQTGYYGFPLHPLAKVVKIAHHGPGVDLHPDSDRSVSPAVEQALRDFLGQAFPELAAAPIVDKHTCVYCDTRDEHFWIARDPQHEGLTVAAGGSGHAFKFAPLLGGWVADAALGVENPDLVRFRWRPEIATARGEEAARQH